MSFVSLQKRKTNISYDIKTKLNTIDVDIYKYFCVVVLMRIFQKLMR